MGGTCARVREIRNADAEGRITVKLIMREVVCERELKPRRKGSNRDFKVATVPVPQKQGVSWPNGQVSL
jgi:hypothetical protein